MTSSKLHFIENKGCYTLEKNGQKISIWQTNDKDVWFGSKEKSVCLELDSTSSEFKERTLYATFLNFMRSLIGRYVLEDGDDEFSLLPTDFIDFKNKTITWHSDNGNSNTLKIVFEDSIIKIYITSGDKSRSVNVVRISDDESSYKKYHQHFLELFNEIKGSALFIEMIKDANINLDHVDEQEKQETALTSASEESSPRKLSLKRFFRKHEKNDSK